nr:FecR domain-containing protein [uncultured Acetatifactor sp.]
MKYHNNVFFRAVTALLAAAFLLSCTACGGTAATTIELLRTQGEVAVADKDGKGVSIIEGLKLYSGYQVDTRSESYAWINLDDTKLAKMDAQSQVEIQKEGKYLEVLVHSGSLFFNVAEPLEEDESMDIRNSTMVVGIRGTCGFVESPDAQHMNVYLLEGKVECTISSPEGEILQTATIKAGETAQLVYAGEDSSITVSSFTIDDVPEYVAEEIADAGNAEIGALIEELEQQKEEENARILDRQRREALLEALNTYGPEEAMYATLGDLNGDGTEDLLIYGKGVFEEPGRTRYDFTFTALIWDGTEVQRIPLQQGGMSDLGYISSDDAAVYRERETGALYVSNPFSEDGWHTLCFENAVDYVSFSYSYNPNATKAEAGNLSAEEIAEREKVYQEINARFELFDSLEFSAADDEYQSTDYWWWWKSYWNRGRTDMPGYPPFHASVEEVRQSLSAP